MGNILNFNNKNKRPLTPKSDKPSIIIIIILTPKSMPPAGDKHILSFITLKP